MRHAPLTPRPARQPSRHSTRHPTRRLAGWPALALAVALTACGGGGDDATDADAAGDGGVAAVATPTCNTALFVAGSVAAPTAAQLAAYAGSYDGNEGSYGPNPGDAFVVSGTATVVLNADGTVSYKGTAYTPVSVCIDKVAGTLGTLLYVHTDKAHLDISNQADAVLGHAWGISLVDPTRLFQGGKKR